MELALNAAIVFIEGVGAVILVGAVLLSLGELGAAAFRGMLAADVTPARRRLAQRLVLAIEFPIAADVLKTIRTPTLEGMGLLGSIIAVRTVLSMNCGDHRHRAENEWRS